MIVKLNYISNKFKTYKIPLMFSSIGFEELSIWICIDSLFVNGAKISFVV